LKVTSLAEISQLFDGFSGCSDDITRAISRSATKTALLDAGTQTHTRTYRQGDRLADTDVEYCCWRMSLTLMTGQRC